jgi:DNA-3-methyladenine glycosylase
VGDVLDLARPSVEVAPSLLGCVLWSFGTVAVRLTEVEAYEGALDPASHAYRGETPRNAVMFGPSGYAYVYFTYGMHFCVNLVCGPVGVATAVLLRAGEIVSGVDLARSRRSRRGLSVSDRDLARGPARLCQALGIDRALNGASVLDPGGSLWLEPAASAPAASRIRSGPRVGIREAADVPWRFWLDGDPTVSPYRPYAHKTRTRPTP